ncbi:hypothetical protein [Aeromicrobium sp.]|uniref:hypothetical protein n=1 Tax=Aeromicrobium sp. TaxID=1871063 RepID=UPI0025BD2269|nr:hypothetical protein [Aeromicrobium sp.]MCK5891704.1 hypothetical protein [Aeromicrobium sp.]
MSEDPSHRSFMSSQFGDVADDVAAALVAGGWEAHARSADAQDGSRLETNQPYGSTLWLAIHDEVISRMLPLLDGATIVPTPGGQYRVIVWGTTMILPLTVRERRTPGGHLRTRASQLRTNLTSVNIPAEPDWMLFGGEDEEASQLEAVEQARLQAGVTATVVVAYRCDPTTGLRHVEAGLATLEEDGTIIFTDSEALETATPNSIRPHLTAADGGSFDDAPLPKPDLGLVEDDDAADEGGPTPGEG